MISIDKTQKRAVLTSYIAMEERYAIVWVQVVSSKSILGIGHFMQSRTHRSTWVKTMKKRIIKANRDYEGGFSKNETK